MSTLKTAIYWVNITIVNTVIAVIFSLIIINPLYYIVILIHVVHAESSAYLYAIWIVGLYPLAVVNICGWITFTKWLKNWIKDEE